MTTADNEAMSWVERNTFPANPDHYLTWLRGHVATGARPTHFYDYPASRWEWRLLMSSCRVPALYGAGAPNLIVPSGCSVEFGDPRGHTTAYCMDGFRAIGRRVPMFSDLI